MNLICIVVVLAVAALDLVILAEAVVFSDEWMDDYLDFQN